MKSSPSPRATPAPAQSIARGNGFRLIAKRAITYGRSVMPRAANLQLRLQAASWWFTSGSRSSMAEPFRNILPNRRAPAATTSSAPEPRHLRARVTIAACCFLFATISFAQAPPDTVLPPSLTRMIETERAFAARALVVGWKQAFLEYFADDAVGFDAGAADLAKGQIRKSADPPKDLRLIWEPRYGDVAGSGELGYLTGPVRSSRQTRDRGQPRDSTYFSGWKQQRNGSYQGILDVGIPTPMAVPYAAGFTR